MQMGNVGNCKYAMEDTMQNGYMAPGAGAMALARTPFSEAELMELAAEFLGLSNEGELDNFLGKLIRRAWRGIRKVGSGLLRPLGSVLKTVAKKALPFVAGAAGTFFGGPVGGALGASVGSALSKALEMEYEALEQEDREFEMTRSFIRLAGDAARQAALAPPNTNPQVAVRTALLSAAQRQMPQMSLAGANFGSNPAMGAQSGTQMGVQQGAAPGRTMATRSRSGQWMRRGRTIMLTGV